MLSGLPNAVSSAQRKRRRSHQEKEGGLGGWHRHPRCISCRVAQRRSLLPVSSLVQGTYDIRDICLSVPSVVGRKGVERHEEIALAKEQMALQQSARGERDAGEGQT